MSVKGCFTDFHIDFGGTSVWYHILHGEKVGVSALKALMFVYICVNEKMLQNMKRVISIFIL